MCRRFDALLLTLTILPDVSNTTIGVGMASRTACSTVANAEKSLTGSGVSRLGKSITNIKQAPNQSHCTSRPQGSVQAQEDVHASHIRDLTKRTEEPEVPRNFDKERLGSGRFPRPTLAEE